MSSLYSISFKGQVADGFSLTDVKASFAELEREVKLRKSHRARALGALLQAMDAAGGLAGLS